MTRIKLAGLTVMAMLIGVIIVISCSRGTPPAGTTVDLGESGTWMWVMSSGGFVGDTIYADSVLFSRQLVFDNSDSSYLYTQDGQVRSSGKYLLSSSGSGWVIEYSDAMMPKEMIVRLDADTMVLEQMVADGYTTTFAR